VRKRIALRGYSTLCYHTVWSKSCVTCRSLQHSGRSYNAAREFTGMPQRRARAVKLAETERTAYSSSSFGYREWILAIASDRVLSSSHYGREGRGSVCGGMFCMAHDVCSAVMHCLMARYRSGQSYGYQKRRFIDCVGVVVERCGDEQGRIAAWSAPRGATRWHAGSHQEPSGRLHSSSSGDYLSRLLPGMLSDKRGWPGGTGMMGGTRGH
jgi:hypothetical protein